MFLCPRCHDVELIKMKGPSGIFWWCPSCDGRSATVALLRKNMPQSVVNALWQTAREGTHSQNTRCPACRKWMDEVPAGEQSTQFLDVCTRCQFVWFDAREYEAMPCVLKPPTLEDRMSPEAREKIAILELDAIRERAKSGDWEDGAPDAWWQWIPAVLGMPVEHDAEALTQCPWVTWGLAVVVSVVSILAFVDLQNVVQEYGFIPVEFGRYGGLTLLTSFFLHGGVIHLLGNMYFFMVFGDNVEAFLGKTRFVLLLVCATVVGNMLHALGESYSTVPCVGASGGISGVLAFYAFAFPHARLGVLYRCFYWFKWITMPAYAMFLIWIGLQAFGVWSQLAGISNVSSLAHLGGVAVGITFWALTRKVQQQS